MKTIVALTFREVWNKKIALIGVILGLVFLILFSLMMHYLVKEANARPQTGMLRAVIGPQIFSMGLYFGSFLVNLFAIFVTVGAISSEVENGVLQTIVPKPICRREIVLGKFIGYGAAAAMFSLFIFAVLVFVARRIGGFSPPHIPLGAGLFVLQPMVLLTLTLWGSTFLSTLANGVAVIMLYMIALVGGMAELVGNLISSQPLVNTGIVTSLIIPADAVYRKMVSVLTLGPTTSLNTLTSTPFGAGAPPSTVMMVYSLLYLFFFLMLSVFLFSKRDI